MSKIDFINAALANLGEQQIASLGPNASDETKTYSKIYDTVYPIILGKQKWSFTRNFAQLSKLTNADKFEQFQYAYQLPNDYLLIDTIYPLTYYQIIGDKIYASNNGKLTLIYYSKNVEDQYLPPYFVEFLIAELTYRFAMSVTQAPALVQQWIEVSQSAFKRACVSDAQNQTSSRFIPDDPMIKSRHGVYIA